MLTFLHRRIRPSHPLAAIVLAGLVAVVPYAAVAAPPFTIKFHGKNPTTAAPGEKFVWRFRVTNVSGKTYSSRTRIRFTFPANLQHQKVAPAGAELEDDMVWWDNVPFTPGQNFIVTLTIRLSPTARIGRQHSILAEAISFNPGDSEFTSKNFWISVEKKQEAAPAGNLLAKVNAVFRSVYGRNPSPSESRYWQSRVAEKKTEQALRDAMKFQKTRGIRH